MNQQRIFNTALFVGSFDPFTMGHYDLVERALQIFDHLVIGIGVHATKQPMFSEQERLQHLNNLYQNNNRVTVCSYQGLTKDLASKYGARYLVRGLRSGIDFEYEESMALVNKHLGDIETVLLFSDQKYQHISSSTVRELISWGVDITEYVPEGLNLSTKGKSRAK